MKSAKTFKMVFSLCLTFLLAAQAAQAAQAEQQNTTVSEDVPAEREIQVPPGLTEPFFVPFMESKKSQDWGNDRESFPLFALVSPAGKVIAAQGSTGYISPLRNGYGFFHTDVVFKYTEYVIYDKQGNIQRTSAYDRNFAQLDGEWFLFQPQAGYSYIYNARTKAAKALTGVEQWWSIPDEYSGKIAYDIHHFPFVSDKMKNGEIISWKLGIKDMNGKVYSQPFFDEYKGFSEGVHRVKINGMTHFVSHDGKVVLKPSKNYKVESNLHSGVFIVSGKKDNEEFYLLMNKKGTFASKKYAFLKETSDGQFIAVSKTKDGYFFQKINAMDQPTSTLRYKLDKPEELKELTQTGKLFHTNSHIVADIANKQPFPFPHKLLIAPRNDTVAIEYTISGMKRMGTFSHEGRQIYSRPVK